MKKGEPMRFGIAKATRDDWDELVGLRLASEAWLAGRGIDQWQNTATGLEQMTALLDAGEMFLLLDGLMLAGCFGITTSPGPKWDGDADSRFQYLRKVMVLPVYRGSGGGAQAVEFTVHHAALRSSLGVRLESQTGNRRLQEHWESHGFTHLRTLPAHTAGVLMERRLSQS